MAANTNQPLNYLPTRIEEQTAYFTITPGATPVYNMVPTEKVDSPSETFTGWVKVDLPSGRTCRITALVDDNGCFKINGVTTEIVEGEHGSRRYTPEKEVYLEPGYYFVECRVQDLKPRNESYSNVKHYQAFIKWTDDNGSEVTQPITQLYDITETGRRDVTICITSNIVGTFTGAKTYPCLLTRIEDNSYCLYDVPIYQMVVKGRNNDGEYVEESFECLRFMPVLEEDDDTNTPTLTQLDMTSNNIVNIAGVLGIYPSIYDASYVVHSNSSAENGGIVLFGNYLIHDGPDNNNDIFGGAGCIEMVGENGYSNLIYTIMGLTGSASTSRKENLESIMNYQRLLVIVEPATVPELVENNRRDIIDAE